MIELPESYTVSKQINEVLIGKIIESVVVLHSPHRFAFFSSNKGEYESILKGQSIISSVYAAGYIIIYTEKYMLSFGDGALPKYNALETDIPSKHQLLIIFEDRSSLTVSIQMYGFIGLCAIGECNNQYLQISMNTLNPMDSDFTYDYFRSLYKPTKTKLSVKGFLATYQRIPGVGNGVIQDVLYEAGLDPRLDMTKMDENDFLILYQSLMKIVKEMCENNGRDTERDLFGNNGGYKTKLSKNTFGKPCLKCKSLIQKTNYMGGTIYFCEHCQRRI